MLYLPGFVRRCSATHAARANTSSTGGVCARVNCGFDLGLDLNFDFDFASCLVFSLDSDFCFDLSWAWTSTWGLASTWTLTLAQAFSLALSLAATSALSWTSPLTWTSTLPWAVYLIPTLALTLPDIVALIWPASARRGARFVASLWCG